MPVWTQDHPDICAWDGCERPYHARGYCHNHYIQQRRRGLLPKLTTEDIAVGNFVVDPETDCWEWLGNRDAKGYGFIGTGGSSRQRAHRWVWETYVEPLEPGMQLDHLCLNPGCVNPDHLEPVDNAENQRRRWTRTLQCRDCGSTNVQAIGDLDLNITTVL